MGCFILTVVGTVSQLLGSRGESKGGAIFCQQTKSRAGAAEKPSDWRGFICSRFPVPAPESNSVRKNRVYEDLAILYIYIKYLKS